MVLLFREQTYFVGDDLGEIIDEQGKNRTSYSYWIVTFC